MFAKIEIEGMCIVNVLDCIYLKELTTIQKWILMPAKIALAIATATKIPI